MSTPSVPNRDRLRLLARVARLYHEQGVRQPDIARQLHLSQSRVSRLLREANELGIVCTVVIPPAGVHSALEEELAAKFGLIDVVVVDVEGSPSQVSAALGSAAASYLDATMIGGDVIGVFTWSATLLATVESLAPKRIRAAEHVVQLVGKPETREAQVSAARLTGRLADVTGAETVLVPCPGLVGSAQMQSALMRDISVLEARQHWPKLTLALVGIGSRPAVAPCVPAAVASRSRRNRNCSVWELWATSAYGTSTAWGAVWNRLSTDVWWASTLQLSGG